MSDLPTLIAQLWATAKDATKGNWVRSQRLPGGVLAPRGFIACRAQRAEDADYIVAAQPQNIRRILNAYAEMERALETAQLALGNLACEAWPKSEVYLHGSARPARLISEGHFRSLLTAERETSAALQQKDKADE